MSDKKHYDFYEIGKGGTPLYDVPTETIESRGYKKAVKSFQKNILNLKKWMYFGLKMELKYTKNKNYH